MTLAEVGSALRARLRKPGPWGIFLLVFGVYAIYPITTWVRESPRPQLSWLLVQFLSVMYYQFAFIWLSPLPWQWDGRPGMAPAPRPRIFWAFLASEALVLGLSILDDVLARWAGMNLFTFENYVSHLCFHGPALFLVGNLLATRERMEWERAELRRKSEEAMAQHLKGQIHPHVLFNALNGLAELMEEDFAQARTSVRAMSDFLRGVLDASQQATCALGEERRLVADFLVMESMRLGDRLRVRWDWPHRLDALAVIPLLVQPLVENALKHGINPREVGGDLELAAWEEGPDLWLEVRNTGLPPQEGRPGVGLRNLRERLALAYGADATFELTRHEIWTVARIRLKLSRLDRAH